MRKRTRQLATAGLCLALSGSAWAGGARKNVWFPDGIFGFSVGNFIQNNEPAVATTIRTVMDEVEVRTPLDFTELPSPSPGIRHLKFAHLAQAGACGEGSAPGYRDPNYLEPQINLEWDITAPQACGSGTLVAGIAGTIRHELLHALGMVHEFQRPDRDTFVIGPSCSRVVCPNYNKDLKVRPATPFDFNSSTFSNAYRCRDLDGDGVADADCGQYDILLANGGFMPSRAAATGSYTVEDIGTLYRTYGQPLASPVVEGGGFGSAVVSGEFDGDGVPDIVTATVETHDSINQVVLYFYRGVVPDRATTDVAVIFAPWFRQVLDATDSDGSGLTLAAADLRGSDIDELIVGDPGRDAGDGVVTIVTVNDATGSGLNTSNSDFRANCATTPHPRPITGVPTWGVRGLPCDFPPIELRPADVGLAAGLANGFGSALASGHFTSTTGVDLLIGASQAKNPATGNALGAVVHVVNPFGAMSSALVVGMDGVDSEFGASLAVFPGFENALPNALDTYGVGAPGANQDAGRVRIFNSANAGGFPAVPTIRGSLAGASGDRLGESLGAARIHETLTGPREWCAVMGAPGEDDGTVRVACANIAGNPTRNAKLSAPAGGDVDALGYRLAVHQMLVDDVARPELVTVAISAPGLRQTDGVQLVTSGSARIWRPFDTPAGPQNVPVLGATDDMFYADAIATVGNFNTGGGFVFGAPGAQQLMPAGMTETGSIDVVLNAEDITLPNAANADQFTQRSMIWLPNSRSDLTPENL
jgi:hypothetical protein